MHVPKSQRPLESHHTAPSLPGHFAATHPKHNPAKQGRHPFTDQETEAQEGLVTQPVGGKSTPRPPRAAEAQRGPPTLRALRGTCTRAGSAGNVATAGGQKLAAPAPRTSSSTRSPERKGLTQEPEWQMQVRKPVQAGCEAGPLPTPALRGRQDGGSHRLPAQSPQRAHTPRLY